MRNLNGFMLKAAHKRVNFMGDVLSGIGKLPCMHVEL